MKLSKAKSVIKQDNYCRIVDTAPVANMLRQWVCGKRAAYPVREAHISYDTLLVAWEMDPNDWAVVTDGAADGDEFEELQNLQSVMERIPETIDTHTETGSALAIVDGWIIIGRNSRAWALDKTLIDPCNTKKRLCMLPVFGEDLIATYEGERVTIPEGLVAVYDDGKLEGLVMAQSVDKCRALADKCRDIGAMYARGS